MQFHWYAAKEKGSPSRAAKNARTALFTCFIHAGWPVSAIPLLVSHIRMIFKSFSSQFLYFKHFILFFSQKVIRETASTEFHFEKERQSVHTLFLFTLLI